MNKLRETINKAIYSRLIQARAFFRKSTTWGLILLVSAHLLWGCGKVTDDRQDINDKAQIEIYGSIKRTKDSYGNVRVLGEVINKGPGSASLVNISFYFKSASGSVVDNASTNIWGSTKTIVPFNTEGQVLMPGDFSGFEIETTISDDEVDDYEWEIFWKEYQIDNPESEIVLHKSIITDIEENGLLKLKGYVKNIGDKRATDVKIIFIIKDYKDQVLDISPPALVEGTAIDNTSTYNGTMVLDPNNIGGFETNGILVSSGVPITYYHKISWKDYE